MALTKTEKEFWVRELQGEIDEKMSEYAGVIEACMEIAREKALKELGIDGWWANANKKWEKVEKAWEKYDSEVEDLRETVREINNKIKDFDIPDGMSYIYNGMPVQRRCKASVSLGTWGSSSSYNVGLSTSWLDKIAEEYFLDSVIASEGHHVYLALKKERKNVERGIMLATTTTQLREFLSAFTARMGIDL